MLAIRAAIFLVHEIQVESDMSRCAHCKISRIGVQNYIIRITLRLRMSVAGKEEMRRSKSEARKREYQSV